MTTSVLLRSVSGSTAPRSRSRWSRIDRETTTVTDLLVGLRERGLDPSTPILVGIDGAKAFAAAVKRVFDHPVIQRTDQPRSHRANHRFDHHPRRIERPRRTRHQHLPHRTHLPRLHDEGAVRIRSPHPPRMAPGLELQRETTHKLSVLIIGKP